MRERFLSVSTRKLVEMIVKLVAPTSSSFNLVWTWDPRQTEDLDVEQIADAVNQGAFRYSHNAGLRSA